MKTLGWIRSNHIYIPYSRKGKTRKTNYSPIKCMKVTEYIVSAGLTTAPLERRTSTSESSFIRDIRNTVIGRLTSKQLRWLNDILNRCGGKS